MELFLKTPPVQEPITIEEVRAYLRLSSEQKDDLSSSFIAAGRAHVESVTGRALLKQQWQLTLKPPYPLSSPLVKRIENTLVIDMPKPPLLSVESLTIEKEAISFKKEASKVILSPHFWDKEMRITFWAGYGETGDSLPPDLKMAVLMAIRCFYDDQPLDLPLLNPFKVFHLV